MKFFSIACVFVAAQILSSHLSAQTSDVSNTTVGGVNATVLKRDVTANQELRTSCITKNDSLVCTKGLTVMSDEITGFADDAVLAAMALYTAAIVDEMQTNTSEVKALNQNLQQIQIDRLSLMQTIMLEKINQLEQPDWSRVDWDTFKANLVNDLNAIYESKPLAVSP